MTRQLLLPGIEEEPPKQGESEAPSIDDEFPEKVVSHLARLEAYNKPLYRPNSFLHKWWARRCGSTSRFILKGLVDDPEKRDFYSPGGLEGKIIMDPMMGGGTTLYEAVRMGASVIGLDVDPIPVLMTKAGLTYVPLDHKRKVFEEFLEALRGRLQPLFQTLCPHGCKAETQFVLYGLRKRCDCREVIVVDSLIVREERSGRNVRICPICGEITWEEHNHSSTEIPRIIEKRQKVCQICGEEFQEILEEPFVRRYVPLIISGFCPIHGFFMKTVESHDMEVLRRAEEIAAAIDFGPPEQFAVIPGPKSVDLLNRGIRSFLDLFTSRQRIFLYESESLLKQFDDKDRLWLALLISTSLEFNCLLCGYKGASSRRPGAIRHVFSHHAYTFPYTALENNPVFRRPTSGTLERLFRDKILRGAKWASCPVERRIVRGKVVKVRISGETAFGHEAEDISDLFKRSKTFWLKQADAGSWDPPENFVDAVVTDPPYFDNVQYADLSRFFRVWLRRFLPDAADWDYDISSSAVAENEEQAKRYEHLLERIWRRAAKALKEKGRLIFTFHHWKPEAWGALTVSLRKAGFVLVNRYVVFSENPASVHIRTLKALKHDVILVLSPISSAPQKAFDWPRPVKICMNDSERFCRDCGSAVGWFLISSLTDEEIYQMWRDLFGGRNKA